tara:strand:- start:359 stop:517 length:159 start_codon:yes stop_codon:yes gene_type:complete
LVIFSTHYLFIVKIDKKFFRGKRFNLEKNFAADSLESEDVDAIASCLGSAFE